MSTLSSKNRKISKQIDEHTNYLKNLLAKLDSKEEIDMKAILAEFTAGLDKMRRLGNQIRANQREAALKQGLIDQIF
jgi:hypothetical protein